jgi:CHAT domain-containing protein/Flp pilus assembly protein TadD
VPAAISGWKFLTDAVTGVDSHPERIAQMSAFALSTTLDSDHVSNKQAIRGCTVDSGIVVSMTGLAGLNFVIKVCAALVSVVLTTATLCHGNSIQQSAVDAGINREAEQLKGEAITLAEKGDLNGAVALFKKARALYQQAHNQTGEAKVLRNLGMASYEMGKEHKDIALDYYSQARGLFRSLHDREAEGEVLIRVGRIYYDAKESKQALVQFDEALQLVSKSWLADNELWLRSLTADCYYDTGDHARAIASYKQVLDAPEIGKYGNLAPLTAEQIGIIFLFDGDYANAATYLNLARRQWHEKNDATHEAGVLKSLAMVSERLGDLVTAISYYEQARSIFNSAHLDQKEAEMLNLIGSFYTVLGDSRRARAQHLTAREILRRTKDSKGEAWCDMYVAFSYRDMGDDTAAGDWLRLAKDIFKTIDDRDGMASALFYLGLVHEAQGDFGQAVDDLKQSLSLSRTNRDLINQLRVLGQIAQIYTKQKDKPKALETIGEEVDISKQIADTETRAPLLMRIGINYMLLGDDRQAIDYYQQALNLYRELGNTNGTAEALAAIGGAREFLGEYDNALKNYDESISLRDKQRSIVRVEELQSGIAAKNASTYQYAARLAMKLGRPIQAFEYSERARARGLLDQLGNLKIGPTGGADAALMMREQSLQNQLGALEKLHLAQRSATAVERGLGQKTEPTQNQIGSLENEIDAVRIQLKIANPEYVSLRTIEPVSLAELQKLLEPNTTLISYFDTENQLQAFVITKESFRALTLRVSEKDLADAVSWFRSFPNPGTTDKSLLTLNGWLIEPLKPYIKTSLVGIIPHGVLNNLPFAALTDGKQYFGDEHTIFYLPSASVWQFIRQKRKLQASDILLMSESEAPGQAILTYADQAATQIAQLYQTTALIGSRATETALRDRASGSGIIFLAAHGELNNSNPLFSRVFLAGDQENDGFLEVREVYALKLIKADLVVLSGCETQLGTQSSGDDLVGLNRAFIYAGTPTVVASLWKVRERPTGELMVSFFENLRSGKSKAQALRAAQEETRRKYPEPYFWAGFVLTGDPGVPRGQ